jgi:hypothetical protein
MITKTIDLKDFSKELKRYTSESIDDLREAVFAGCLRSIGDLVTASPVDTGLYANSWDVRKGDQEVTIGNFAPHSAIIEYGARPFTPPIKPLLQWAKRVLGDPSQPPNYSPDVWALAKGTQNKIAREGIRPKKVMEMTIPKILENIELELKKRG